MSTHGLTLPTSLKSPVSVSAVAAAAAAAAAAYERDPIETLRDSLQADGDHQDVDQDHDHNHHQHHHQQQQQQQDQAHHHHDPEAIPDADADADADSIVDASPSHKPNSQPTAAHQQQHGGAPHRDATTASTTPASPQSVVKPRFRYDVDKIYLAGTDNLDAWIAQSEAVATANNCYNELTQYFNVSTFPPEGTVMALVCSTRFTTAWRILEETISGPVWAMMRVYQLQAHYKAHMLPNQIYDFARWAALRVPIAGTEEQPQDERMAMVTEAGVATPAFYPNQKCYEDACEFLHKKLDDLIRLGDWRVAAAIYDPVPDWCPKPPPGMAPEGDQGDEQAQQAQQQQHDQHQHQSNGKPDYASPYPPLPNSHGQQQQDGQPSPQVSSASYPAPTTSHAEAPAPVAEEASPPAKRRRGRPSSKFS